MPVSRPLNSNNPALVSEGISIRSFPFDVSSGLLFRGEHRSLHAGRSSLGGGKRPS
jgi:hypothetical protein